MLTNLKSHGYLLGLTMGLTLGFCAWRIKKESAALKQVGIRKAVTISTWDPRGFTRMREILAQRESDAFRDILQRGIPGKTNLPVFQSALVSWTWLQILQALHVEASYTGDFSWIYAKLYFLLANTPEKELPMVSAIAPFFLLLGKDKSGALLIMNELIRRGAKDWRTWFWYGFYANEVLAMPRLASDLYKNAAMIPGAPVYTAALAFRLQNDPADLADVTRRRVIQENLEPHLLEQLQKARPEWFTE